METKKNIRNDLFSRNEISLLVSQEKNPQFAEIKKMLSLEFKKSEDCIDVFNIKGKFGRNTFLIKANIYDSKQDLINAIQKSKKQLNEERKTEAERKKAEADAKKKEAEEKKEAIEKEK